MGRAETEQAGVARGHPHRAASVGAERKVRLTERDHAGRARGRAARDALWSARIFRRAVMGVLAGQTEREFIGLGEANQICARGQQQRRRARGVLGGRMGLEMGLEPERIAGSSCALPRRRNTSLTAKSRPPSGPRACPKRRGRRACSQKPLRETPLTSVAPAAERQGERRGRAAATHEAGDGEQRKHVRAT